MTFVDPLFPVALTLLVLVALAPLSWRLRKLGFLLGSYVIYACWDVRFLAPLLLSTVVDYTCARRIAAARPAPAPGWLALSLVTNLGLLIAFRTALGLGWTDPLAETWWFFPLGISFYTFQTLSYTIDVARGDLEPCDSFLDFALFVGFFPQLLAGPIVRARTFLPQLRLARRPRAADLSWGVSLLVLGAFAKVVLADYALAPGVDQAFALLHDSHPTEVWVASSGFFVQVYLDFAGYSLCAVGTARCLGFDLPRNFYAPFAARSMREFWRCWHVTLTSWVRDYVFTPLSRTRPGRVLGSGGNMVVCFTLIGFWHGPGLAATFWGFASGCWLALEFWASRRSLPSPPESRALRSTLILLCGAPFVFLLRSPDLSQAKAYYAALVTSSGGSGVLSFRRQALMVGLVLATLVANHALRSRTLTQRFGRLPTPVATSILVVCLVLVLVFRGGDNSDLFFYLRF